MKVNFSDFFKLPTSYIPTFFDRVGNSLVSYSSHSFGVNCLRSGFTNSGAKVQLFSEMSKKA